MNSARAPIALAGSQLGERRHVCAFFSTDEEEYRVLLPFIKDGFACGDKAVHVVNPHQQDDHLHRLAAAGIDAATALHTGQLDIKINTEAYLRNGRFDQDRMLGTFEQLASGNDNGGFPLSRIVCRMDWVVGDESRLEDVIQFESRVNDVWSRHDDAVICTYNLTKFGGDAVIDILRTHPMVIVGGILHQNPFFVPPDVFLSERRKTHALTTLRRMNMDGQFEDPTEEISRLRHSISDLVSILSLPAMWVGGEASHVVSTLLDALLGMLDLDFVCIRLKASMCDMPLEMVRCVPPLALNGTPREIGEYLDVSSAYDADHCPPFVKHRIGDSELSIVPLLIGLQGDMGVLLAGSKRTDFPGQTELLILSVAANQAAIGLREARLLGEQKSLAIDLDRRVAQRTNELARSNEALELQVNLLQQAQENLRRAEEKTRLIVDTALDAVVTMDADGIIGSWNEQAAVIFGWSNAEAIGQRMSKLIIPEELRAAHERGLRHFLASGDGPLLRRRIEIAAVRRSGVHFPVELQVMPLKLGQEWFFSAFIRDITESKRAQQLLRQSEFNLRQMTEAIPEMLWSATPDGLVDYCNMRVLDYSGLSAEEIMGEGWKHFFHPDDADRAIQIWASCLVTGEPYRVEVRILHAADRTYRWCITSALPLLDQDGRILKWFGTVVDMHDWKQSQEELRKTQAELAHVTRVMTMGQFTASIAHEVNQPLSGIITNASTCLRILIAISRT